MALYQVGTLEGRTGSAQALRQWAAPDFSEVDALTAEVLAQAELMRPAPKLLLKVGPSPGRWCCCDLATGRRCAIARGLNSCWGGLASCEHAGDAVRGCDGATGLLHTVQGLCAALCSWPAVHVPARPSS